MNLTQAYTGGSPIYEREGRHFVKAGIGTIGWGIYECWREVDFDGNPMGDDFPMPEQWIFPDPAVVAEQARRVEAERVRLELAEQFPVEGMSGEFTNNEYGHFLSVWVTSEGDDACVLLSSNTCHFCATKTHTASISTNYDNNIDVCSDCLGKMFDAFEAHEVSE